MVEIMTGSEVAQQACAILGAWARQDTVALREEFGKGLRMCACPNRTGRQDEELELLEAVVSRLDPRLDVCPVGLDPHDPVIRLCVSLLLHLANKS
jgi:hypothetical protein